MIHTVMPFALDRNYGSMCNYHMSLIPNGDWLCIMDHDCMWTTRDWYRQLTEVTDLYPDAAFTCVTNRIASTWQQAHEVDKDNHDIAYHRMIGKQRAEKRTLLNVTHTRGWGGVVMCLSKAQWLKTKGFPDGLLCVDHGMFFGLRDAGYRIYMLENAYVYHWRRANGDDPSKEWPKAEGCRCRGPEPPVNDRLVIGEPEPEHFVHRY